MNETAEMFSGDAVSAALAECYITIGENRYNFMQAINMEAKFTKKKTKVPILGKTGKGNKTTGWEGTGKATFHYNQSIFRNMMHDYKQSGKDAYFEIQIINDDPTSKVGKQEVILLDCNIDGGILAKFDANGEYLDEEMEFTCDDLTIKQEFELLDGFVVKK